MGIRTPFAGVRLKSLPGTAGLDRRDEAKLQIAVVADYRRYLRQPSMVIGMMNQRRLRHLNAAKQKGSLFSLIAQGMVTGTLDLLFQWDHRMGAPGNIGACWVDMKRAVDPEPVSPHQLDFVLRQRAMGKVAGWAQCLEHVEALLDEAGAPPRRVEVPLREVPPWWAPLGALPPLYGPLPGNKIALPGGGFLTLPADAMRDAIPANR